MDSEQATNAIQAVVDTSVSLVSTWGLSVIGAIALLILGRMVAGIARNAMRRGLERGKVDPSLIPFFSAMVYYALLAAVVIAVLNLFGIETTSVVAVLAAAGLAVGLALQGTLSNFAAGIMLLLFRPFRIGEYVEVSGTAGSIVEIGIFSTVMNTPDNVRITVPNGSIYGNIIKNYSANENRRVDLVLGISYGDDIAKAIEVCNAVLAGDERVLSDPASTIAVSELGDSSVNLVVRPWCKGTDYWPLRFALTRKLKEEIEAGGCSIPFPQRDLHVISS